MVIIIKWLGLRRKDNPAWFKLVKELEENPDQPIMNWLDVIEKKYDGSLIRRWREFSRAPVPIVD